MNLKKKSLLVLLVLCVSASVMLAGCGGKDKAEYVKGTITDTGYESAYLNIKFTAPEGLVMGTEEEMQALMQAGSEIVYEDADKKLIDYAMSKTVYEMMVSDPTLGVPNVSLIAEKAGVSLDKYFATLSEQLQNVSGISYKVVSNDTTATIAGQEYKKLAATAEMQGVNLYQDYYCRELDGRIVSFIVTYETSTVDAAAKLLEAFQPLQ